MAATTRPAPVDEELLVDGERSPGAGWIDVVDPTRPDELAGRARRADAAIAETAVVAADRAFDGWAAMSFEDRAAVLLAAADAVTERAEGIGATLCREMGKVLGDSIGETRFAAAYLRDAVATTGRVLAEPDELDDELGRLAVTREPHGVVSAIIPWNAPLILAMLKVAPALATGNTMVVKPSPVAPLAVTHALAAMAELLPPGVLNVVNGDGEVGRVLTGHPLVAKVGFTGGLATGQAIMRNAAETVKPLVLELGGNDAAIILDDADLTDAALERLVLATFITSGQVCMAAKRVLVHASRLDEVVERYREVADRVLVVGDPFDPSTTVGPVATPDAVARQDTLEQDAVSRGGTVTRVGSVPDPDLVAAGWFALPSVVTGVDDEATVVAEEQFGPTVPIVGFDSVDEAVARTNASPMRLASSVWSADEDRAFAVARRLRVGYTFINTHNRTGMTMRAPFGGRGLGGFGREYGEAGVREYLATHTIHAPAAYRDGGVASASAYPGGAS